MTSDASLTEDQVWDPEIAFKHLHLHASVSSKRAAERLLHELGMLPAALTEQDIQDELGRPANRPVMQWALERARSKRQGVVFAQFHALPSGRSCLHINDTQGARFWIPLPGEHLPTAEETLLALGRLQTHIGKAIAVFPSGALVGSLRHVASTDMLAFTPNAYPPILELAPAIPPASAPTPHLRRLEAESIEILREAVAEAENPVMLYSVGKDSAVMLHLARKAFYPGPPPFPLLHVDTRWKFQEMYLFRDYMAAASGMNLLVHVNPEAIARDINPFDHGSGLHTDITKTEGLKQALGQHGFDIVFGGARRDEEKSRAKERIFSFRSQTQRWDPKSQRPELWSLYNARKRRGESIRVFPLSNWTELDIWQYIYQEAIPVVPLYFAKERPVVMRDGMILMVDDSRFRFLADEKIEEKRVRFRTLGCYPLTGAVESNAATVPDILLELIKAKSSERQGRAIDTDATASMEKKKQEGYF